MILSCLIYKYMYLIFGRVKNATSEIEETFFEEMMQSFGEVDVVFNVGDSRHLLQRRKVFVQQLHQRCFQLVRNFKSNVRTFSNVFQEYYLTLVPS